MLTVLKVSKTSNDELESARRAFARSDVYFSPAYCAVSSIAQSGEPYVALYSDELGNRIYYPFIKRVLASRSRDPSNLLHDIVTPYGYSGALIEADDEAVCEFREAFEAWCESERVVTEFCRFNPFVENHAPFGTHMSTEHRSSVVRVRVDRPIERMWGDLSAANRRSIRRAERAGLSFERCDVERDMDEFIRLYEGVMRWREADRFYFFSREYFESLASACAEYLRLFRVHDRGRTLSMALCLADGALLHYHLGGYDRDALGHRPNNLLFWSVMRWGAEAGFSGFNLGGGKCADDSVHRFKRSFGPDELPFFTGKHVFDHNGYSRLSEARRTALSLTKSDFYANEFFPLYRLAATA